MSKDKKLLTKEEKAARNKKRLDNYNPTMAARNAMRREFSRSPTVINLMNDPTTKRHVPNFKKDGSRAKVDGVEHKCSKCQQWKRSTKGSKVAIDHIDPVVDPEIGFVDFNTYFVRMWVANEKLQKLCGDCHNDKTNAEWFVRRFKEEQTIVDLVESNLERADKKQLKKVLQRFTPKKLGGRPYPPDFVKRVQNLKEQLRNKK